MLLVVIDTGFIVMKMDYFSCGGNTWGQCGIGTKQESIVKFTPVTYSKQNKITVTKVCASHSGIRIKYIAMVAIVAIN